MTIRISTDKFTHTGGGNFNAEASAIGRELGPEYTYLSRLPERVLLVNPKTGGTRLYEARMRHLDREGDVTHWTWWAVEGGTLTVWND